MTREDSAESGWSIDRRTALKGAGIGLLGGYALPGSATAKGGPPDKCECPDDTELLAKYEFECLLEAVEIGTAEHDGEEWLTLYASWGTETVFTVTLDEDVYGGWPSNPDSYMMEVVIDASYGECHDEYRFGFHGGDGEEGVGGGGYVKPNFAAPGESTDRETFHESDVTGYSASESTDQHTYTFTVNWDELTFDGASDTRRDSPGFPDSVDVEVFGSDGGEGIGESSGCLEDVDTDEEDECIGHFVFTEGDDVVDITYEYDEDTYNKDGEHAEPNYIEYEADGYIVEHICAYGGRDTSSEDEPDGEFTSALTNPGGQEAAISNIIFCVAVDE